MPRYWLKSKQLPLNAYVMLKTYVMRSVRTCRMSQNAKLSFWFHFKAESKLFPEFLKFCLHDIHIQSYDQMILSSSILLYTNLITNSSHFSKYRFATSDRFSQIASHNYKQGKPIPTVKLFGTFWPWLHGKTDDNIWMNTQSKIRNLKKGVFLTHP